MTVYSLNVLLSWLELVYCSISNSNNCFLTCIQISQEAGQVVQYSHLFQNFPQSVVTHTIKGFGEVNKADIDDFLELSHFFDNPTDVGNMICGSSAFSKSSLFFKRWEYQTTWPAFWEICMQVRKQQLELDIEQLVPNRKRSTSRLYIVTLLI